MEVIESLEDQMIGVVTIDCGRGHYLKVDRRAYLDFGLEGIAKIYRLELPKGRLPLLYHGDEYGTLPEAFDTSHIQSTNWLYEARRGDIVREGERYVASNSLGPADIQSIKGWRPNSGIEKEE